jgi:hypothetical protein
MANVSDILLAIRSDLEDWMATRGYGRAVYIAEAPIDEITSSYAIQIIPAPDTAVHPNSGVGMIRTQVDIVVWWQGHFDPMQYGTQRIAGDRGIQPFVDALRVHCTQRQYDGMLVPLVFRSGGTVEAVDGLDGWLTCRDSYDFCYEMLWGGV